MTDDTGFGVTGTFGGVIPSPGLDGIAASGLRYTNFNSSRAVLADARRNRPGSFEPPGHTAHMGEDTDVSAIQNEEQATPKSPGWASMYRRSTGLRGMAILLVMFFHFAWAAPAVGTLGELLGFFATPSDGPAWTSSSSSPASSSPASSSTRSDGPGYFRNFYARRVLRIFPLYYGCSRSPSVVLPHFVPYDTPALRLLLQEQGWLWAYAANLSVALRHGSSSGTPSGCASGLVVARRRGALLSRVAAPRVPPVASFVAEAVGGDGGPGPVLAPGRRPTPAWRRDDLLLDGFPRRRAGHGRAAGAGRTGAGDCAGRCATRSGRPSSRSGPGGHRGATALRRQLDPPPDLIGFTALAILYGALLLRGRLGAGALGVRRRFEPSPR